MSIPNATLIDNHNISNYKPVYEEIILVDDDDISLYLHRYMVHKTMPGSTILSFNKFDDAYNYLHVQPAGNRVLLIDHFSRNGECFSFLRKIETAHIACRILVISNALPRIEDGAILDNKNVAGFIKKPLTVEKLAVAI